MIWGRVLWPILQPATRGCFCSHLSLCFLRDGNYLKVELIFLTVSQARDTISIFSKISTLNISLSFLVITCISRCLKTESLLSFEPGL